MSRVKSIEDNKKLAKFFFMNKVVSEAEFKVCWTKVTPEKDFGEVLLEAGRITRDIYDKSLALVLKIEKPAPEPTPFVVPKEEFKKPVDQIVVDESSSEVPAPEASVAGKSVSEESAGSDTDLDAESNTVAGSAPVVETAPAAESEEPVAAAKFKESARTTAKSLKFKAKPAAAPSSSGSDDFRNPVCTGVDFLLNFLRWSFWKRAWNEGENVFTLGGSFCYLVVGVIGLILTFRFADIISSFGIPYVPVALLWIVVGVLFSYSGAKLNASLRGFAENSKEYVSSKACFDICGLLSLILAVVLLGTSIYLGVTSGFRLFLDVFIGALACFFFAVFSLNLDLVGIKEKKETSGGQELVAILSFVLKSVLRAVPFVWGIGSVLSSVLFVVYIANGSDYVYLHLDEVTSSLISIFVLGFMPIIAYATYLIYSFVLDLASAILSLKK